MVWILFFSGDDGTSRPTLPELLRLKVPQGVGANYTTFGVVLLNDELGSRVDAIDNMYCRDGERICLKILQEWLEGKGLEPVTWNTLIQALRDSGLSSLADHIRLGDDVTPSVPSYSVITAPPPQSTSTTPGESFYC